MLKEAMEALKASGLTFDGDVRRTNTNWYVKEFEAVANLEPLLESQKSTLFKSTLRGAAAQLGRLLDTPTYSELKTLFLSRFWSNGIQRRIITALQPETCVVGQDGTPEPYFLKWATHAKYLDEAWDNAWIIDQLMWHCPQRASDRLELRQPSTIWEAARILKKMEGYGMQLK